jgi:5'-3' exonuclease
LCGTDYNENIRGIGPIKALALIKKHQSLEAIDRDTKLDVGGLNYEVVRRLFACPDSVASLDTVAERADAVAERADAVSTPSDNKLAAYLKERNIAVPLYLRNFLGIQRQFD